MKNILVIAKNTLKLEIRDKILYALIAFAIGYVFLMFFLASLVLHEVPMLKSFGLTGIYFFNAIIAIFLGTTALYKDIDRKIVYFVLAKPVSRAQFLLGKFLGLCLVFLLTSLVLAVAYLGVIALNQGGFDVLGLLAIAMQFLEMALFLAFAMFVSTFSTSLLSIVYTSVIFFLGHVVSFLLQDARAINITGMKYRFIQFLYYAFPNLEKFDARNLAVHQVAMPFSAFFFALAYAVIYIAILLFAGIWIFEKKEL
jgi:ABC-type transport system involved in multi-copper enzyme maturation permease subunit